MKRNEKKIWNSCVYVNFFSASRENARVQMILIAMIIEERFHSFKFAFIYLETFIYGIKNIIMHTKLRSNIEL